jgi:hypothetical protein
VYRYEGCLELFPTSVGMSERRANFAEELEPTKTQPRRKLELTEGAAVMSGWRGELGAPPRGAGSLHRAGCEHGGAVCRDRTRSWAMVHMISEARRSSHPTPLSRSVFSVFNGTRMGHSVADCCSNQASRNQNISISSTQAVGWSGWLALSFQPFPDPQRISATIQYGMHTNRIPLHTVVDGKREALGETTAMTVYGLMNSGVHEKGVNV